MAGNLYGTTSAEGACDYCGVVFKLWPDGTETVLRRFNSRAGKLPYGGVVVDGVGNLYGATSQGGANKDGVAFKITPDGAFSVLHDFAGGQDGSYPFGDLLLRASGSIYGTTQYGGAGYGVLYRLEQNGLKALYSFPEGLDFPQGGLIEDEYGNLFGAAYGFEPKGTYGAVFELMR
jgi:uncharacterized repeat protein (TIGR03803 family)